MAGRLSFSDIAREALRDSGALRRKRRIVEEMYQVRSDYEPTWRQLSKYINPYRGRFDLSDKDKGARRDWYLIDPMPQMAHDKCAAGLHAGLTSPSRPWFMLKMADDELNDDHLVRMWLDDCQEMLMSIYAKSNIYNCLMQIEAELSQFGTAACLLLQDYDTAIWGRPYTCGEYAGMVDDRGRVVKFCRKMKMRAYQIVEEFGKEFASEAVLSACNQNNMQTLFGVWMLIEQNPDYDPDKLEIGNFPWRSCYFEERAQDGFLRVQGFYEVPFLMPRWHVVGNDTYGTGPGHDALGNCMQLQKLEKLDLQLLDNRANPPLVVPTGIAKVNRQPGGITQVPDSAQMQITPLFNTTGSREDVNQKIAEKRAQIQSAFYNDLFVMLAQQDGGQPLTAREVAERHEEKLLMLSPVLEQMHNEVLAPLTKRAFGICLRNGIFPPVPQGVDPEGIKVEFVSLLAQAQQMVAVPAIEKTVAFAGNLLGAVPEVLDNLNIDNAIRRHAQLNGAPEIILRSSDEVEEVRKTRAEQMQQQQQAAQMAQMAQPLKNGVEAAKLMAETRVTPDSLLKNILGGV